LDRAVGAGFRCVTRRSVTCCSSRTQTAAGTTLIWSTRSSTCIMTTQSSVAGSSPMSWVGPAGGCQRTGSHLSPPKRGHCKHKVGPPTMTRAYARYRRCGPTEIGLPGPATRPERHQPPNKQTRQNCRRRTTRRVPEVAASQRKRKRYDEPSSSQT
jgi:hypothetical protein